MGRCKTINWVRSGPGFLSTINEKMTFTKTVGGEWVKVGDTLSELHTKTTKCPHLYSLAMKKVGHCRPKKKGAGLRLLGVAAAVLF